MPLSRPNSLSRIMDIVWNANPTSILDVGVGFGGNGVLFRQYTDIRFGRYKKWRTKIDGIEIFKKYKNPIWKYIYNKVIIGDAWMEIIKLPNYDIIFLGDVLEHLEKSTALSLLDTCIKKANKFIIISTPATFRDTSIGVILHNNPYEKHRCFLEDKDFPDGSLIEQYGAQKLIIISKERRELRKQSYGNLLAFKYALDNLKVPFALAHGTLLGAYRDGDFLPGDEMDVDISINEEYLDRIPEIFIELEKVGLHRKKYWVYKNKFRCGSVIKGKTFIDILVFFKKGNEVYHIGPKKPISNKEYTAFVYPAHCFKKYEKLSFGAMEFNIPQNVEDFFVARYGKNWREKKPWGLMGHLNPKVSPSLKINYEI